MKTHCGETFDGTIFLLSLNSPYFGIRKYRSIILTTVILLVFIVAPYTLSYRPSVNVNNLSYVSENTLEAKKAYLDAFGSPDSNAFYLEGIDFLSEKGINFLYQFEQDIQAQIPFLKDSNSIIKLFPPSIHLPLEIGSPEAERNQKWLKRRALSSLVTARQIISEDGRKTLLVMDFETLPSEQELAVQGLPVESPYISIGRAMEKLLQDYLLKWARLATAQADKQRQEKPTQELKIWSSGAAHIVYQQFSFYLKDLRKIFILLLCVMLLLIFLMLRSWLAFIGTISVSILANWLTIGFMSILGFSVDLTFLMIPVTIGIATAIGYSVHFYNHFKHSLQHTSVDTALAIAWLRCIQPITFTALTTMFSFLSLWLVPIPAIQATGYVCLLETLLIYILTMTLFPLLLSFTNFKEKYNKLQLHNNWALSVQLERLIKFSFRFQKTILSSALLLFLIGLYYISGLRANYKFSEFMGQENQIVKDLAYLEQTEFAPVGNVSIIVYNENGLFMNGDEGIAMLQNLNKILKEIEKEDAIKHSFWLGELIEDAAQIKGQKNGVASISSMAELNGLLLLSKRLSRFDAARWLSLDQKSLRILLEVKTFESQPFIALIEKYRQQIETAAPGSRAFFTGFIMDTSRGDLLMTQSFIKSIIFSILIVFALLLLIFRRLYVTLVSLIPNVFSIVMIGGIISFLDINLNSFNFLMFPMVIGLIVDDTIHFFHTVVSRFDSSKNYKISINMALAKVGPALVETTIILCTTFSVFFFSKFQGLAYMGVFTVIVILIALYADLVLGPLCLSLLPIDKLQHKPLPRLMLWKPISKHK